METAAHRVVVIGAGPGGLAVAGTLRRLKIDALVLERGTSVGTSWRGHYDRLHLHTVRWLSGLPGLRIPKKYGRWVSRDHLVSYLEEYARHLALSIQLQTEVTRLERTPQGWSLGTSAGAVLAEQVVVVTGYNLVPHLPAWEGRETFSGELLHASRFRNGATFRGKDVLVVGAGNSGAEIAVDLAESGAGRVWLSVRTPPNILRRQVLGVPMQVLSVMLRDVPPSLVDPVARGMQRVTVGDLTAFGLPRAPRGVFSQVARDGVIPILDVGLIDRVKQRRIEIVAAVERFDRASVVLADGARLEPGAMIAATGYRRGLESLVGHLGVLGPDGCPLIHGATTSASAPSLYFMGYTNPISGNLRELGIDAKKIARAISSAPRSLPS